MRFLSEMLVWCWARLLYHTGALWYAKRQLRRHGAIVVLNLHRVLDGPEFDGSNSLPCIVLRNRAFESLVRYVSRRHEVIDLRGSNRPVRATSRQQMAITFDDGWEDNYRNALPILRKYNVPATIFLCTSKAGMTAPFWPERVRGRLRGPLTARYGRRRAEGLIHAVIEALKYSDEAAREDHVDLLLRQNGATGEVFKPPSHDATMTWDQVAEMYRYGVSFGSHSRTHAVLTGISPEEVERELRESKRILEERFPTPCEILAYPNGDSCSTIRDAAARAGYRFAFTTERSAWWPSTDPFAIPRANIGQTDVVGMFGYFSAAKFEYASFWKIWRSSRAAIRQGTQTSRQGALEAHDQLRA